MPDMVACSYNPNAEEVETPGFLYKTQPTWGAQDQHETLFQNKGWIVMTFIVQEYICIYTHTKRKQYSLSYQLGRVAHIIPIFERWR